MSSRNTCIYLGRELADYGFRDGHPFGPQRHDAFRDELLRRQLDRELGLQAPVAASLDRLRLFHTDDYIEKVRDYSISGRWMLARYTTSGSRVAPISSSPSA